MSYSKGAEMALNTQYLMPNTAYYSRLPPLFSVPRRLLFRRTVRLDERRDRPRSATRRIRAKTRDLRLKLGNPGLLFGIHLQQVLHQQQQFVFGKGIWMAHVLLFNTKAPNDSLVCKNIFAIIASRESHEV